MPRRDNPGAPSKFKPEVTSKIIEAILKGATYELACNYAQIDYTTFRRYILRGEKEKVGDYRNFYDAVKKAEGEAALKWLGVIDAAMAKGEWQAASWKLERRYWKGYSKHVEVIGLSEDMENFKEQIKQGGLKNEQTKCSKAQEDSEE